MLWLGKLFPQGVHVLWLALVRGEHIALGTLSACSLRLLLAEPLDKVCLSKSPMDFLLILTRLSFLPNSGNTATSVTNTKIGNIIIYKKDKICNAVAILT